jgi:hypothetical protein
MPASVITPKYRIANRNIAATGAVCWMPATTNADVCAPNPAATDATTGTMINATSAVIRQLVISASTETTVTRPTNASTGRQGLGVAATHAKLDASLMLPVPL